MSKFASPSPRGAPLPSSTPAIKRFSEPISPRRGYGNDGSRCSDRCSGNLHEISPIVGTSSSFDTTRQSNGPDRSFASPNVDDSDHKELTTADLLDKLSKDSSAFAGHLRNSLLYGDHLRTANFMGLAPSLGSPTDTMSLHSALLERICKSLVRCIKSDVSMTLEYKEACPEVIGVQSKNSVVERVPENARVDAQSILHPIFDSDREAMNDAGALALLQHDNIVRYFDAWSESETIVMALEFCHGGSLFDYLYPNRPFPSGMAVHDSLIDRSSEDLQLAIRPLSEPGLKHLLTQMSSALAYLHTNFKLVHGDVKPSNILLQLPDDEASKAYFSEELAIDASTRCVDILQSDTPSGIIFKLSDFGRSTLAEHDTMLEALGDGRYLPSFDDESDPIRVALGRDVYALGAGGDMTFKTLDRFRSGGFDPEDALVLPSSLRAIVTSMLQPYAADRPTSSEVFASISCGGSELRFS
ncbi:unnamed protein product [Hydatigera taeniaeformis]|uniref:Protein kinase domain-containing protein n=1 Tax=Hydatigena taeniaeformis TaxID=6205 RepID=A0A0R3X877_HYDTA|nr:unnamed protein product [Hydatigera taeniaeformis]